ncbi:MAG: porphobilinogen synthase [Thaumarchaeota archaeon]|nr:porphobilinogen synthase [Nitrososphaerota archaeon]MCL5316968.1 porphobilinogen synthase [Nitrososphaerota archaeon]
MSYPEIRLRRLRRTEGVRRMVRQIRLSTDNLIHPIFVQEGVKKPVPISSMPGVYRLPLKGVEADAEEAVKLGIPAVILFGIPAQKDEVGSSAYDDNGIVQSAVKAIKARLGEKIVVITDLCLCEYTSHGHCGVLKNGAVVNDETLKLLGQTAVSQAKAGADIVAPSGMMDGQVYAIREALDDNGYTDTIIMAYSAKSASAFYSPFREAAESTPQVGDRRSYQMDYSNPDEAMREIELDIEEGADMIMVKPALAYLDLISRAKSLFEYPTAAYNVSGEYALVKAAAEKGWIDEKKIVLETLTAIRRAGADMILTYHAKDAARWLREDK